MDALASSGTKEALLDAVSSKISGKNAEIFAEQAFRELDQFRGQQAAKRAKLAEEASGKQVGGEEQKARVEDGNKLERDGASVAAPVAVPASSTLGATSAAADSGATVTKARIDAATLLALPVGKAAATVSLNKELRDRRETNEMRKKEREVAQSNPYLEDLLRAQEAAAAAGKGKGKWGKRVDQPPAGAGAPAVPVPGLRAPRPSFNFVQPGALVEKGEHLRARLVKEQIRLEEKEITGHIRAEQRILAQCEAAMSSIRACAVPPVEWWDAPFLPSCSETGYPSSQAETLRLATEAKKVSDLVQHPVLVRRPGKTAEPAPAAELKLTPKEIQKMRRQRKEAARKDLEEQVRLRLVPPPPPRLTLSNMNRVLGAEAIADPTKAEAMVRAQVAERLEAHIQANEERALTAEERKAKEIEKMERDKAKGMHRVAFTVRSLANNKHLFRLNRDAAKHLITGTGVQIADDVGVIVAEGSQVALNHFKALVLRRIKWDEPIRPKKAADGGAGIGIGVGVGGKGGGGGGGDGGRAHGAEPGEDEDGSEEDGALGPSQVGNAATVIWEGPVPEAVFPFFKADKRLSASSAKSLLRSHKCEHLLELALNAGKLEDE